jgi:hypothetical protein
MKIIIFFISILSLVFSFIFNSNIKLETDKDNVAKYIISNSKYDTENIEIEVILDNLISKYGGNVIHKNNFVYSNTINKYKVKRILNFIKKKKLNISNITLTNQYPNILLDITIKEIK